MKKILYSSPKADIVNISTKDIILSSPDNDVFWDKLWSEVN